MKWFRLKAVVLVMLACTSLAVAANTRNFDPQQKPIRSFIKEMAKTHKFDAGALKQLFKQARLHPSILEAIARPAESKPWHEYRPIFVTRDRLRGGVRFWQKHAEVLTRAEQVYRVPAEILVAIIGVETRYGRHTGRYPVLDSLATLAFAYPPRSAFFRGELEQYLLMTREEKLNPLQQRGSYAGAMGMPQFISSSFRSYAIDFDRDGQRDLWHSPADAIGSVANYFKRHGWRDGEPVVQPVRVKGRGYSKLLRQGLKPKWTAAEMRRHGVQLPASIPDDRKGILLELEGEDGTEHWVGWHNFYVISRYNHSALYSLAVYQLSRELLKAR